MDLPFGDIVDIPPDLVPPEIWPEYEAVAMPHAPSRREEVGTNPAGIRWGVWPIIFEEYVSDTEPVLADAAGGALAYNRAVACKRVRRTDIPPGWHQLSQMSWRIDGFAELRPGEDYTAQWHPQTRRNLRLWQTRHADKGYRIEEISMDEYRAAYKKSTVKKKIGNDPLSILERKQSSPRGREHRTTWGVRNTITGEIIAGLSLCHSPTYNSSAYESPFILPEARKVHAMTALVDHWYAESARRGIKYQVYNSFWQPGEPKDWKNFSAFKAQFGPSLIAYPPTLWHPVRGKLF
jgi:hypothetical protein